MIFHNGGGFNNDSNSFAAIHLPSTMGVNGVTLPALTQLSSTATMTANHFLMPKQVQQQQQDHCLFAPFVSQIQMNEADDSDDHHHHHQQQDQQQHDVVSGDEEWAQATFDPRADLTTPTQELDLINDDDVDDDISNDNDGGQHDNHGDLHWF